MYKQLSTPKSHSIGQYIIQIHESLLMSPLIQATNCMGVEK